jgi:sugar/nucleoside kinase (ribokinase family)
VNKNNRTPTADEISPLIAGLVNQDDRLRSKVVTAGHDGFVDTIVKIIKSKEANNANTLFQTTREFGDYIVQKSGSSFGLEVETRDVKLGGNMPIMAHSLGMLGARVNCIGAFGYPQPHSVFRNMSDNCRLFSFADPGGSTAYEFNDGKIMVAQMGALNDFGWEKIKKTIGLDTLIELYTASDLLAIVNWSEIDASSDIWKGILADVFSEAAAQKKRLAFFDLSDCSKRSNDSIEEALQLLKQFSAYARVVLSLNKNETRIIHNIVQGQGRVDDFASMGNSIFEKLGIELVLLHSPKETMAINGEGTVHCNTFFIEHPKLSTGAGDHFNAGFAASLLLDYGLGSCLLLANAVSAFYVENGISPRWVDVSHFLQSKFTGILKQ